MHINNSYAFSYIHLMHTHTYTHEHTHTVQTWTTCDTLGEFNILNPHAPFSVDVLLRLSSRWGVKDQCSCGEVHLRNCLCHIT